MNNFQDMQRSMVNLYHDKLKKICEPLQRNFNVNHFYHYQLKYTGEFIDLGLHADWEELFFSKEFQPSALQWPTFRNPRKIKSGLISLNLLEHQVFISTARVQFGINHCLEWVNKNEEGIEAFGFGLETSDRAHQMNFTQELPLLKLFIKYYQNEFKSYFNSFRDYEVNISNLIGPKFYEDSPNEDVKRKEFLREIGIETSSIHLSKREKDVAKYLTKGYTASQVAKELFISARTVENHLERIKDKLHCHSKSELTRKVLELESIGYF